MTSLSLAIILRCNFKRDYFESAITKAKAQYAKSNPKIIHTSPMADVTDATAAMKLKEANFIMLLTEEEKICTGKKRCI